MTQERREFPRVPQPFEVRYHLSGELTESWRIASTVNLSAGGMRLEGPELLETGHPVEIQLNLAGRHNLIVLGRVVWSQPQPSGATGSGIEFVDLTPEQRAQIDEIVRFLKG